VRIGIFSKFEFAGGSENRCVEMANALARYTTHRAYLLCEAGLPARLERKVEEGVVVCKEVFTPVNVGVLYELDTILVVNSDSRDFCTLAYWEGRSTRHRTPVELNKLRQLVFLFNFIVSPSRSLHEIEQRGPSVKIITTNRKFLEEIGEQERYEPVRHLPRIMLESPIDPRSVGREKTPSAAVRLGMHSTAVSDKWNAEWPLLIEEVNQRCGAERVAWNFMGMPRGMRSELARFPNVTARQEFSRPVRDFLRDLDVFAFFTSYQREEPWARSVGEALMSGCPVLATKRGGNRDQIVSGNNGFLCKTRAEFVNAAVHLVEHPERLQQMRRLARRGAREFSSRNVIRRFVRFVGDSDGRGLR
jgi:hypothetical protein